MGLIYDLLEIPKLKFENMNEKVIVQQYELKRSSHSIENRWNRISNNDQWTNMGYPHLYKKGLVWPLKLSITNDPMGNKVYYQCYLSDRILSAVYNTAFPTDQGLSVYIMNDASDGKPFDIYSIDVSYSYMTESPTKSPTFPPTQQPSMPTLTPTVSNTALTAPPAITPVPSEAGFKISG